MPKREFTISNEYHYNRTNAIRWIISHLLRNKPFMVSFMLASIITNILYASVPILTGMAFTAVLQGTAAASQLLRIVLLILGVVLLGGLVDLTARLSTEILGKRLATDSRDELYVNLLGKSQTFHNRQRVGDIMARAANDMTQLSNMIVPGVDSIFDSFTSLFITLVFIGLILPQLLLAPLLYVLVFIFTLRLYSRQLQPVSNQMRDQFGKMNAVLTETVSGIEVVKSTAQESQEQQKFAKRARLYRDLFIKNGEIQARYLPPLFLGIALAGAFLHGLFLVTHHQLSVGSLVAYMGLMGIIRFPTFISIWSFNLVQLGIAGAQRILTILREETELDENENGYSKQMRGEIVFENVKLVNRIYDVQEGHIFIDGVDLRDWSMDALRSQISTIEQDIFLFSRSITDNIAYGLGQKADQAAIEQAAHDAQAHDFILNFKDGYKTVIGERGVTLSGGQRQRIAIARALLTDPRILVLDDSTSAIDSATEDEIQKAIRRLLQGRTTLLITHRLSQIRWADKILVLRKGELIDQGTHSELIGRCELYRRIFIHRDRVPTGQLAAEQSQEVPLP